MHKLDTQVIGHAWVVTLGEKHRVIENGAVAYNRDQILAVGDTAEVRQKYPSAPFVDAGGRTLLPGLINGHMHLYSTFARGIALKDAPPENFVQILERLWWRLDKALTLDDLFLTALVPLLDAVRNGVTTLIDHHASPFAIRGSLNKLRDAFRQVGVRGALCYETSDRDGPQKRDEGLEENAEFIRQLKLDPHPDVAGLFGLHASFTLDDTTLRRAAELIKGLGTGAHIHVAEDKADLEDARRRGYRSVVDRLHKHGLTGERSIFAHCVHTDAADRSTLALTRTWVAHNPRSNMGNAVGCADLESMMAEKVPVVFGTDGMAASPLGDFAQANLIHKHHAGDPRKMYGEIWQMFSQHNPQLASAVFSKPIGVLAEGYAADMVLWNYVPCTPMHAGNTLGHLLFGMTSATVNTSVCQGKVIYKDGVVTGMPETEERQLMRESRRLAAALWERW